MFFRWCQCWPEITAGRIYQCSSTVTWIDILFELYSELFEIFAEREENVKSDIFHAYITLLKQTKSAYSSSIDTDSMDEEETPVSLLQAQVIGDFYSK